MQPDLDRGSSTGARERREPAGTSRHGPLAQLLIAWSPLSAILLAYVLADWLTAPLQASSGEGTNRLGFALHVAGPADLDRAVFGTVPTVWLQVRLVDGAAHWYDAVAAAVYVTHFVAIPLVTALAWFLMRDRFKAWVTAVLTFTLVGVGGYVVYPAAPPWLASERGAIGAVDRISNLGWDYLHLDLVGQVTAGGQAGSNPVAAMPSLHAGAALLVALFLWPVATAWWRAVLVFYVLAMALSLVYTGEHYVADVVAGWLTATVAVAAGVGASARRATARFGDRR